MTPRIYRTMTLVALLSIAACSGAHDHQTAAGADATQQADEPEHVWKEQVEAIDRAKEVEQTLKDADEAKRKAIEDAGGG